MDLIVPVAVGAVFVALLAYYVVILIRGDSRVSAVLPYVGYLVVPGGPRGAAGHT